MFNSFFICTQHFVASVFMGLAIYLINILIPEAIRANVGYKSEYPEFGHYFEQVILAENPGISAIDIQKRFSNFSFALYGTEEASNIFFANFTPEEKTEYLSKLKPAELLSPFWNAPSEGDACVSEEYANITIKDFLPLTVSLWVGGGLLVLVFLINPLYNYYKFDFINENVKFGSLSHIFLLAHQPWFLKVAINLYVVLSWIVAIMGAWILPAVLEYEQTVTPDSIILYFVQLIAASEQFRGAINMETVWRIRETSKTECSTEFLLYKNSSLLYKFYTAVTPGFTRRSLQLVENNMLLQLSGTVNEHSTKFDGDISEHIRFISGASEKVTNSSNSLEA
eukprot:CAMPEP_0204863836 /NCGR_PEP_ID=MMETSP1348-20121228/3618_1 /ASSEMBLY_ACC=CAM_ASM_000700 /TAXON_ID=215587 /ORGANISM="Aplanochytrium stocchinoi, Strain GSBS06" /LENGTH=338 /DNA_ID=CAMNT_0052014281 /DNA_START=100 /DNA_END=1116 /DNA_ORIENTATION=-